MIINIHIKFSNYDISEKIKVCQCHLTLILKHTWGPIASTAGASPALPTHNTLFIYDKWVRALKRLALQINPLQFQIHQQSGIYHRTSRTRFPPKQWHSRNSLPVTTKHHLSLSLTRSSYLQRPSAFSLSLFFSITPPRPPSLYLSLSIWICI